MNNKLTLAILLIFFVVIASFGFVYESNDSNLKRHQTYSKGNEECRKKCESVKGVQCGSTFINCCQPGKCNSYGFMEICDVRIGITGCTDP